MDYIFIYTTCVWEMSSLTFQELEAVIEQMEKEKGNSEDQEEEMRDSIEVNLCYLSLVFTDWLLCTIIHKYLAEQNF